jgi:diguanylate cyclase (GGDEF)-like protein/PAS domain S-box-containing protein
MKYYRSALLSSLLVGCSFHGQPAVAIDIDGETIKVGIYQNEPKVFLDKLGEPTGFWPELLDAIAEDENWTVEYVPCEWRACLNAIEAGSLDLMLDVSYIEEREARFDFNHEVVVSSWSVVYVRADESSNAVVDIIDLDNLRLGVLDDGVQYKDLSNQAKRFNISPDFVQVPNYDVMLQWLMEGRIDAGVMNRFTGALAETQYPISKSSILVAPTQVHFVAPNGQNADLLAAIDRNLIALKADKESIYYQLLDRWLKAEEPLSREEIIRMLWLPVLTFLTMLAIAVLLWNRRLRREVDRRKATEAALRDSQSWLQRVLSAAEIVCWEEDLEKRQIKYFGLHTPGGWQAQHWQTNVEDVFTHILHPDDVSKVRAARKEAIQTLDEFKVEHRIILPNQKIIWVFTVGQVITAASGAARQIVGSSIDITDRKRAEQSLVASEEQLRLSLELTNIGTWDWQTGSDRVHWSDNHYRIMGYPPEAIEPSFQAWRNVVHPDDLERVDQALATALSTQTEYSEEYRIVHPDGSVHWVLGHGHSLQNEQGETVRMVGVMLDITERKHTEEALRQSEKTKRQILEAIPDLLIWTQVDGTCVDIAGGGSVDNLFGPGEMMGRNQYEVLPPSIAAKRRQAIEDVQRTGEIQIYEQEIELNGVVYYEEVRVVPIEIDAVLIIIRNISDRKLAEFALAESEQRYRIVTENMTDLVCLHGSDGRYLYVTPSCQTLLGYTQDELLNRSPYEFFHVDDLAKIRDSHEIAALGNAVPVTYRFRHKSGHYVWLETLTKPIVDELGQVLHLQTTSREVSDRVAMEQRLRYDALHDALTNLPNRLLLEERLELALKRAKRHPDFQFAVLFVDCDRFKIVNDSLGHSAGDQLLRAVAQKFSSFIRDTDLVARIGGDEFVFLLEDIETINEATQVAERIINDLRSPFNIEGQQIFISASIGIVMGTTEYTQAETLVRNADIAMYRAKANGRASYTVFDPAMHTQVLQHLRLENDLRRALKHEEFRLFYQPIVSLKTLQIIGFEALLRWQHPSLGLLTPDTFIDIVEETDLICPLGEWILLSACRQVRHWQARLDHAADLKLTVNLSVKQLRETVLIPQLQKVLATTQLKPQNLTLEITENLLVENIDKTSQLLNQVQSMGVKISIDDFGTGYSSLSYLHQLPVDSLKIDRTFVSPSEPSIRNQTVAESIVGLSNLLDLKAVAEGIETPQQLEWLRSLHCEYGQGYLFSKPVSASEAEQLLSTADIFVCLDSTQFGQSNYDRDRTLYDSLKTDHQ